MTDTSPTPADQLRAAADLLREAAGHATPGPWRTHDTHLGGVGGHTATVLTDRPNLNDTELIAWLPTMSHELWDEARNAWRNAGWMALVHPGVGLALAAWLESWVGVDLSEHGPMPEDAQHALAVARQLLGTSAAEGATAEPSADRRARYAAAIREADGWVLDDGQHMIDAVMAVADAEQASLRAEAEGLDEALRGAISASALPAPAAAPLAEVWTVWREDKPIHGHFATVADARQGTIDCWQDDEPVCPDYSWRKVGPNRLELVVGGVHGGVYASRHRVYGAPPAPADRAALTDAERQFLTFAMDLAFDEMVSNDGFTDEDHAALDKFRALATPPAAPAAPEEPTR
ncbi:hypothetical protein [Streptomyces griseus]|uniref:hypothetical protein n=1 Tax=Streptomyces griseus TaxID=1911 RepID=UPI00365F3D4F